MKPCPFCGSAARIYANSNWRVGLYARGQCKNKACGARGPTTTRRDANLPWAQLNALPSLEARKQAEKDAAEATGAAVKAEAERAWNERTPQPSHVEPDAYDTASNGGMP